MEHMNGLLKFTYTIIDEEITSWQPEISKGFVFVARQTNYVVFKANTETLDPCQQSVVAFDIDKYGETNGCLNKFDTLVLNQYVQWNRVHNTDHLKIPEPIPTMKQGDTLKWTDLSHKLINETSAGVDTVEVYHDETHSVTLSADGDDVDTVYLDFANYEFWDPKKYTPPVDSEQVGQKTINTDDAEMQDKDDEKDNNQQHKKDESNKENEGDNNQQSRPKAAKTTEINDMEQDVVLQDDVIQDDSNKENQDEVMHDDSNKENEDDAIQYDSNNEDSTQNSFPSDASIEDSEYDEAPQIPFPPNV